MRYSVITINFNNRDGLLKTIESVVGQTCKDFEYIVIDGGSTDGSRELIESYDKEITYWISEPDKGIFNAMNKGIAQAVGDYLIFMNSGDYFYDSNVLETVLPHLTADILQGSSYNKAKGCFYYCTDGADTMRNMYASGLNHQACFIRRSLFDGCLYDENYRIISDWLFFIRKLVIENCSFANIPVMVSYLEGGGVSETMTAKNFSERAKAMKELFPKRIIDDYEYFRDKRSPVLDLIPRLSKSAKAQAIVCRTLSFYIKVFNLIDRLRGCGKC